MDMITVSAKTVDEAVTKALIELETTSDKLEYEVVEKGSSGFLGIGAKPAVIRAKKKERIEDRAIDFLNQVFQSMNMEVSITAEYNPEEREMNINMEGSDMGILIGKRGQTLDSLQYLVSLVVNKKKEEYIRVKLDTENYREKRWGRAIPTRNYLSEERRKKRKDGQIAAKTACNIRKQRFRQGAGSLPVLI